jgi:phosphoribosylformylglycinamidine synthase
MIGLLDDVTLRVGSVFQRPGDLIAVLGETRGHLGGSMYWALARGFRGGSPPPCDLDAEFRLQRFLHAAAAARLISSAHDCSDGGLAVALAEAAIGGPYATRTLGAGVHLELRPGLEPEALLFGEDGARGVISFDPAHADGLRRLAAAHGVPFAAVGSVGAANGEVRITVGTQVFAWPGPELRHICADAIPRRMAAAGAAGTGAA